VTWVIDGSDAGAPLLREANRALLDEPVPSPESLRWMWFGVVVAMDSWDNDMWTVLSERQVQVARDSGALVLLGIALAQLGAIRMLRGDFDSADAMFEEAIAVSQDTGTPPPHYVMLALHGFRGDVAAFDAIAPDIVRAARESGEGLVLSMAELTRALLCNGRGNYGEALDSARSMHAHAPFLYESLMLIEYVEAAVRCGDGDAIDEAFTSLQRSTSSASGAWGRGVRALAEALVGGDDPHVEARYIAALDLLGRSGMLPYLGRAHLLYGEWLRRIGRRADSRQQLRTAHELLTRIGCRGFAERAGRELDVTGETSRRGGPSIRDELTRQELQVAQMAAEGLSNREIGQRMYLSHRTVSSHLYRAFPKLGITSRTQLHLVLPRLTD
jgi:DNA-binding CsgD family transcriptional regulator